MNRERMLRRLGAAARRRGRTEAPEHGTVGTLRPLTLIGPSPAPGLPGHEVATSRGRHLESSRNLPLHLPWSLAQAAVSRPEVHAPATDLAPWADTRLEHAIFLDLETCGFAGTPLFLVGVLEHLHGRPAVRQLLARTYAEEASVVQAAASLLNNAALLVTFNGKSYDMPFLRDRAARFGIDLPEPPLHLDLLHSARRLWKRRLPDCRLGTLETHLTGHQRRGDVPGSEVPARYHRFVRTGNPKPILPVLSHNRQDLLTLVELLAAAAGSRERPERRRVQASSLRA